MQTFEKPEDILGEVGIFSTLDNEQRAFVYSLMRLSLCRKDEILFEEGSSGDEMFIVIQGLVNIEVTLSDGKKFEITRINAGNFFGEMSIIEQLPRSATCSALADSVFLRLKAGEFLSLLEKHPEAAVKILYGMLGITAERLANTGSFVSQMVVWGENARKRAITDEATGLFNRRYLDDSMDSFFRKAKMENRYLSYAMFDLDRFGTLNKNYGLPFGDSVIVTMSKCMPRAFEKTDILVRYGGDEFTFLFPDTTPDDALKRCEKLCEEIRSIIFPEHPELRISCSIGIAAYPVHADSIETLREAADKALYTAKETGRDRAVVFNIEGK
jgi:diguanylate cyclase (GGDEF)-like protein